MIKAINLEKSYGKQVLFKDLSFNVNRGEKIGLVGRNGFGKTTLFQLILGRAEPDEGTISIPRGYRIGCLEQHIKFSKETVLEEGCLGLHETEEHAEWKVAKMLSGLGFSEEDMQQHPSTFSGGFQIRLNLAKVLVANPDLLLLDEPNNYLDIVAIRWLTNILRSWKNELMLITHDRQFMDGVTTHTMLIHRQKVRKAAGNTEKLYNQIAQEEEIYEKTRLNDQKKRKQTELFISRFRAKARLAGMVQSRVKSLEKQKKLDALEKQESLDFSFNSAHFPAARMMAAEGLSFSYSQEKPYLIDNFSINIGKGERICVIGKNGKGKSTLLNILSGGLKPVTGELKAHPDMKLGYFGQTNIQRLNPKFTIEQEIERTNPALTRTQVRNICGTMMFGGDLALKKVSVLSGGEKSRTLLAKILAHPSNLLLLDEPNNHLDMESIDALIESLQDFPGALLIVTHNERILRALVTKLIVFHRGRMDVFDSGYDEFLEKIGWEDETEAKGAKKKLTARNNYNEKKEREKAERKEKARIAKIEAQILKSENSLKKYNEQLVIEANRNNLAQLNELSKKISQVKQDIEDLYSEYAG
ncbi:ABC-F family ATP-binding cassette domain-containing protein [candidate division KSB1 bacterium]|nr:ABC-F family ATP-binding cassette domain-containing protein [candidate division KSB1 bacterium]